MAPSIFLYLICIIYFFFLSLFSALHKFTIKELTSMSFYVLVIFDLLYLRGISPQLNLQKIYFHACQTFQSFSISDLHGISSSCRLFYPKQNRFKAKFIFPIKRQDLFLGFTSLSYRRVFHINYIFNI